MSSIRFVDPHHWDAIERHLSEASGERFAFALTNTILDGERGPLMEVVDVILVSDDETEGGVDGWCIADRALDRIHNRAAMSGHGLIEFHNHRLGPPGFSRTDERALAPMVRYMIDLLAQPYAAAVWAGGAVHAEWWRDAATEVERGRFRTVLVLGDQLRVLNARPVAEGRFARQLPLLGPAAQAAIATLRVAVVGAGGTGSHAAVQLAHLGFRDAQVLDDDSVEETNLNRLVTAVHADLGTAKNLVAERRMRAIDPESQVEARPGLTPHGDQAELLDVDLIIGCVDHDGPRERLNQIAVDTRTPYLDIATGVDDSIVPPAVGGRVILVRPGRPCLMCLGELDSAEAGRWVKPAHQQELDRRHGYGTSTPNPSVVYLNGLAVSAALAELTSWLSGARCPAEWLDIDLLGTSGRPGISVGPIALGDPDPTCVACSTNVSDSQPDARPRATRSP